jgi:hypothetical protein
VQSQQIYPLFDYCRQNITTDAITINQSECIARASIIKYILINNLGSFFLDGDAICD